MFNSISTAFSTRDELGHCYFGEQYSDPNGSDARIAPASQFKSAAPSRRKSGNFFAELKRRMFTRLPQRMLSSPGC